MGKSTINGPFSIAMLVYQRVYPDKIPWTHLVRRISGNTSIFFRDFAIFHDPILSGIPMEYHEFWVQSILLLVKQVKRPFQVTIDPINPRSPIVSHDIPTKSPLNHYESPGLLVQPPIFDAPDGLKCVQPCGGFICQQGPCREAAAFLAFPWREISTENDVGNVGNTQW